MTTHRTLTQSARAWASLPAHALTIVPSKRGVHVYFKKNSGEVRIRQWALNGLSGDVRGDKGYCIAWDLDRLAEALDKLPTATPTAESAFPKGGIKTVPQENGFPELVPGNRNNALNELVFSLAQGGQTEFGQQRATALAEGLDVDEVDATIKSASEAATSKTYTRKDATRA